jgi:hypothetical protein
MPDLDRKAKVERSKRLVRHLEVASMKPNLSEEQRATLRELVRSARVATRLGQRALDFEEQQAATIARTGPSTDAANITHPQKPDAKCPAPFPSWLGPLWFFIIFCEGRDWTSLVIYGAVPWLVAWIAWRGLARTEYFLEMPSTTVDAFWRWAGRLIWVVTVILAGSIYYANHYLPEGPLIDTGDVVCQNDDMGPCREQYTEDVSGLNIPKWAKFLKGEESFLLLFGCVMTGCFASGRPKGGYGNQRDNHYQ